MGRYMFVELCETLMLLKMKFLYIITIRVD